jgi:hypothetical protein
MLCRNGAAEALIIGVLAMARDWGLQWVKSVHYNANVAGKTH